MIKKVEGSEFQVTKRTIAATKLQDGDEAPISKLCQTAPFAPAALLPSGFRPRTVPLSGFHENVPEHTEETPIVPKTVD